ncbi:restriction endonuclease subunit S [Marivita sp.]|uniref:restriction endonuclease subunit S n=1 Tax=Marivita sp. TaxID=2003365 RepID=UPI003B524488
MSELPRGWAEGTIEDVLGTLPSGKQLDQGWSPRCENFPSTSEETWGALKTTAIQDGWFEPEHTKQLPDHLDPKPELEVKPGDVLLTCAGPRVRCGVICRVGEVRKKLFISGKMYRFRPDERIVEPDYLMGLLRSPHQKAAIDQIKTGGSESGLNLTQDRFKGLKVKFPPLPEQRRIVRKLDTLSTRTNTARSHLSAIARLVERYRQSVIDAAFAPHELTIPLLDLVDQDTGIPYGIVQTGEHQVGGVPTVRAGDIKGFRLLEDGLKLVEPRIAEQYSRTRLRGGEVLIAIRGSVGETCIVPCTMRGNNISREVALIPVAEGTDAAFIMYFLRSVQAAQYIKANIKGVAQTGINLRDLKRLPCPDLAISEQHEIVRAIEAAFAKIDRLSAEAEKALKLTGKLDQQILAKAFAGELVPQDPTDEPASVLLDRIRAERASAPKPKRGRRKKADA